MTSEPVFRDCRRRWRTVGAQRRELPADYTWTMSIAGPVDFEPPPPIDFPLLKVYALSVNHIGPFIVLFRVFKFFLPVVR